MAQPRRLAHSLARLRCKGAQRCAARRAWRSTHRLVPPPRAAAKGSGARRRRLRRAAPGQPAAEARHRRARKQPAPASPACRDALSWAAKRCMRRKSAPRRSASAKSSSFGGSPAAAAAAFACAARGTRCLKLTPPRARAGSEPRGRLAAGRAGEHPPAAAKAAAQPAALIRRRARSAAHHGVHLRGSSGAACASWDGRVGSENGTSFDKLFGSCTAQAQHGCDERRYVA
jgi:hypothetical protein